jgi:hypothetical protein
MAKHFIKEVQCCSAFYRVLLRDENETRRDVMWARKGAYLAGILFDGAICNHVRNKQGGMASGAAARRQRDEETDEISHLLSDGPKLIFS